MGTAGFGVKPAYTAGESFGPVVTWPRRCEHEIPQNTVGAVDPPPAPSKDSHIPLRSHVHPGGCVFQTEKACGLLVLTGPIKLWALDKYILPVQTPSSPFVPPLSVHLTLPPDPPSARWKGYAGRGDCSTLPPDFHFVPGTLCRPNNAGTYPDPRNAKDIIHQKLSSPPPHAIPSLNRRHFT